MADFFQSLLLRSWADRLAVWRRWGGAIPEGLPSSGLPSSGWPSSGWHRRALSVAGGALAVGVLVAVGLGLLRSSTPAPRLTLPQAQPGSGPSENRPPVATSAPPLRPASAPVSTGAAPTGLSVSAVTVTVHVAGQVTAPGLYVVPAGARAADAIVAAGGTTAEADVEALNLAARVADGERVYVPRKGETPPTVASRPATGGSLPAGASGAPIDLNVATAEQLDSLPGVGPATSAAILTYRSSHGRFRSVTELLEVPGIGPAKLEALRPRVRV